jgi:hypothetical protein
MLILENFVPRSILCQRAFISTSPTTRQPTSFPPRHNGQDVTAVVDTCHAAGARFIPGLHSLLFAALWKLRRKNVLQESRNGIFSRMFYAPAAIVTRYLGISRKAVKLRPIAVIKG